MILNKTFPVASKGVQYQECVQINGSLPIVILKHNAPEGVTVSQVGNSLCVSIKDPQYSFDLAIELLGACLTCTPVTVNATIEVQDSGCPCVDATFPEQVLPPLVIGEEYYAVVQIDGTAPFEMCGYAVPRCMTLTLRGNFVEVKGKPEIEGGVFFSVRSKCNPCAECAKFEIT